MGPWGALIMSFFAGVFFVWATVFAAGWTSPLLAVPPIVFVVVVIAATLRLRNAPAGAFEPTPEASRILSRASMAEGVGIPIVAMTLANTGHGDIVLSGIAIVVGLHFLPMAYAIPFRPFYALGGALIGIAGIGIAMDQPTGSIVVGFASAAALWLASLAALRRPPQAMPASTASFQGTVR